MKRKMKIKMIVSSLLSLIVIGITIPIHFTLFKGPEEEVKPLNEIEYLHKTVEDAEINGNEDADFADKYIENQTLGLDWSALGWETDEENLIMYSYNSETEMEVIYWEEDDPDFGEHVIDENVSDKIIFIDGDLYLKNDITLKNVIILQGNQESEYQQSRKIHMTIEGNITFENVLTDSSIHTKYNGNRNISMSFSNLKPEKEIYSPETNVIVDIEYSPDFVSKLYVDQEDGFKKNITLEDDNKMIEKLVYEVENSYLRGINNG